jgi:hypothetical protein
MRSRAVKQSVEAQQKGRAVMHAVSAVRASCVASRYERMCSRVPRSDEETVPGSLCLCLRVLVRGLAVGADDTLVCT